MNVATKERVQKIFDKWKLSTTNMEETNKIKLLEDENIRLKNLLVKGKIEQRLHCIYSLKANFVVLDVGVWYMK